MVFSCSMWILAASVLICLRSSVADPMCTKCSKLSTTAKCLMPAPCYRVYGFVTTVLVRRCNTPIFFFPSTGPRAVIKTANRANCDIITTTRILDTQRTASTIDPYTREPNSTASTDLQSMTGTREPPSTASTDLQSTTGTREPSSTASTDLQSTTGTREPPSTASTDLQSIFTIRSVIQGTATKPSILSSAAEDEKKVEQVSGTQSSGQTLSMDIIMKVAELATPILIIIMIVAVLVRKCKSRSDSTTSTTSPIQSVLPVPASISTSLPGSGSSTSLFVEVMDNETQVSPGPDEQTTPKRPLDPKSKPKRKLPFRASRNKPWK